MPATVTALTSVEALATHGDQAFAYGRNSKDRFREGRSVDDQMASNRREAEALHAVIASEYPDIDRSASRWATRVREQYQRLLQDIKDLSRPGDYLIAWEISRLNRTMSGHVALLELTMRHGVRWVLGGRVYDPNNKADRMVLYHMAIQAEQEADGIQERNDRTARENVRRGTPTGLVPFGYMRRYHEVTRAFVGQFPHPEEAPIVLDMFERAAARESINSITALLRDYRPTATHGTVRAMLRSRAYLGERVHKGEYSPGAWEGIVPPGLFWAVQEILNEPGRASNRDTRVRHLLSGIARCGMCPPDVTEAFLRRQQARRPYGTGPVPDRYACNARFDVSIPMPILDAYVETALLGWLSSPAAASAFRPPDTDKELEEATGRLLALRRQLDEARHMAATLDPVTRQPALPVAALAALENSLGPQIQKAERVMQRLSAAQDPVVGRALAAAGGGADMLDRLWNFELGIEQRRHVLRQCVNIALLRSPARGCKAGTVDERRVRLVFLGQPGFVPQQRYGERETAD